MNKLYAYDFDVIVVGAGHAGIEAAHAAAQMGSKTLLITLILKKLVLCAATRQLVVLAKDTLCMKLVHSGGLMPKLCSKTYLQARMLNTSKGPAVQGLRLQIDKFAYNKLSKEVSYLILKILTLHQGLLKSLLPTQRVPFVV